MDMSTKRATIEQANGGYILTLENEATKHTVKEIHMTASAIVASIGNFIGEKKEAPVKAKPMKRRKGGTRHMWSQDEKEELTNYRTQGYKPRQIAILMKIEKKRINAMLANLKKRGV